MAVDNMSIHIRRRPAREGISPESPVLIGRSRTPAPSMFPVTTRAMDRIGALAGDVLMI